MREGGTLCEGLSAVGAGSGFEDMLSLSSGWTFEGQLSTDCCRIGAGSSTGYVEDHRWRSGWSGAPKGLGSCFSAAVAGMFLSDVLIIYACCGVLLSASFVGWLWKLRFGFLVVFVVP